MTDFESPTSPEIFVRSEAACESSLQVAGDSSRGFFGGLFLLGVFWCEFNCNDLLTLDAKNDMHSSAPGKQQKLEECRPWKTHPVSNVFFKLKTKWWWQQIIIFPVSNVPCSSLPVTQKTVLHILVTQPSSLHPGNICKDEARNPKKHL